MTSPVWDTDTCTAKPCYFVFNNWEQNIIELFMNGTIKIKVLLHLEQIFCKERT